MGGCEPLSYGKEGPKFEWPLIYVYVFTYLYLSKRHESVHGVIKIAKIYKEITTSPSI